MSGTIERLKELDAAATPGPWTLNLGDDGQYVETHDRPRGMDPRLWDGIVVVVSGPTDEADPDGELIAAMRNALPALLAVAEAAANLFTAKYLSVAMSELDDALAALDEVQP